MSAANIISFNNFCKLCMRIKNAPRQKKFAILKQYINNWKKRGKELKEKNSELDDSFFPVFRLLLPQLDRERGAYGVKEVTLARIYIRILSLPKDGRDAVKLMDFRAPKSSSCESCDFAEVAYWILKSRCAEGGKLSVEEVNKHLDAIASCHALNEPRGVDSQLVSLLSSTSAEEQKWLIRILLKGMKLGLPQNSILKCYHLDAVELYEATNNLKKVCDTLKDPQVRLNEIEVELFAPFRPMLSEECDIQKIDLCFAKSPYFFIETKLDGERFQVHMKEGCYKYFSRNGYEYTSNFGETCHEGMLTPRIAVRFCADVKSFILDGEMMIWSTKTQSFGTKAHSVDVKNLKEFDVYQPCFCVFDLLYYNGNVFTNKPLDSRLTILRNILKPLEGAIVIVNQKKISSGEEVIDLLNEAIDNREEGIVMKEPMSVYKPNIRKNGGWYKIKPEYTGGLSDTLDLLIIGGYYGSGRHKGNISHFLLGVSVQGEENKKLFYSTARVGSGYSIKELTVLLNTLGPYWKVTETGKMPPNIEWSKEKPDVWIEPEKSFVLEIKAVEIISSNLFRSGYSLRFPRVEKIRYDKSWTDCLTLDDLTQKKKVAQGKLVTSHFTPMEIPKKKSKRSVLSVQNKAGDTSHVAKVSNLLEGKEICVFSGFEDVDKHEIEIKIIEFGGAVVKNPGKNTFCILAEDESTVRIKNAIQCGFHDIIFTSWFYSQLRIENNELLDLKPEHFLSLTNKRKNIFSECYDEFGDHYTLPATMESIKYPMMMAKKKVEKEKGKFVFLTPHEKHDLDVELFEGKMSPYGLFRNVVAYFDKFKKISDPSSEIFSLLKIAEIDFRFRGGKCSIEINDQTTHVVLFSEDFSRLNEIKRQNKARKAKFHIVTEKWIEKTIEMGTPTDEMSFSVA